jgi:hypothetical protein
MRFQHKYIAEIGNCSKVADDTGEPDLHFIIVYSETQGILNRPGDEFTRNAFRPVGVRQKVINHIQIDALRIRADEELSAAMFDVLYFHDIILNRANREARH